MDLAHIDNEKKDYYYYPNNNTKIEVIFRTREDGKMEKVTRIYNLAGYSSSVAEKIRERQTWDKFGQSANNPNNKSVTSFGDDVEMEILINYKKKSPSQKEKDIQNMHNKEINKVFYFEQNHNVNPESKKTKTEAIKTEEKKIEVIKTEDENNLEIKPKKSLVKCRHCGDSSHWSIKCPTQQNKLKEIDTKEKNHKKEEYEKQKSEKNYDKSREQSSVVGLKVSDLDESLSEGELKDYFHQFGTIINFFMIKNKKNHQFNGTVYVTYKTQEENNNAMTNIKRKPLNYMIPTVEEAKKREY
jgi:hypothetical protein